MVSINPQAIRTRKLCKQKETEVLKYNLCTACPKFCEYDVELVVLFPQEVERGLHKLFPFKVVKNNGLNFHYFDDSCPYFRNGLCELYGTNYMPIDCQIYPVTPISHKAYFIDENCLLRNEFQNDKHYIKRCLKKVHDVPEDFLRTYKDL